MHHDFHFNYKFDPDFGKYSTIPSHLKKRTPRYPHLFYSRSEKTEIPLNATAVKICTV